MDFHVPIGHSTAYEFFRFRVYNLCAGPRGYARLVGWKMTSNQSGPTGCWWVPSESLYYLRKCLSTIGKGRSGVAGCGEFPCVDFSPPVDFFVPS